MNITSGIGTISNQYGDFKMPVSLNDTLRFSGIQFKKLRIVITQKIIENNKIEVQMVQNTNELEEISLHIIELSGNLATDLEKYDKPPVKKSSALDFSIYDFNIPSLSVAKQLDPDNINIHTDQSVPLGGDLIGLAGLLLKPLTKEIRKIGKTRRDQKAKDKKYKQNAKTAPEKIRIEFGDDFFITTLGLPAKQIDGFINFCITKGITDLYLNHQKIQMIDVFLKERKNYIFSNEN